jgi:triosephosphate isomerase
MDSRLQTPIIIVNFKAYLEGTGKKAVELAKKAEKVSKRNRHLHWRIREAGATGTLINHSERQLKLSDIDAIIKLAHEKNLVSCVCTNNPSVSAAVAALKPDIIAIEPPELIGTGVAVSVSQPEIVTNTVRLVREVNSDVTILCGAGISHGEDVAVALKLGTQGVLVASSIVKAKNPYGKLREFVYASKQRAMN